MIHVPAFCDNCGNVFPSGMVFENVIGVTMSGNKSQCPRCGFLARIPDGVFNFYQNAIEVLNAPETTKRDLQIFRQIIQNASTVQKPVQEVQEEIQKKVPKLSFLAKFLPKDATELIAYLAIIGQLFGGAGGSDSSPNVNNNPTIINQNFNVEQTYNQLPQALEVHKNSYETPHRKIGRNEPCPCNSGKKFKHCHGK
jgi:hypothetical protein